MVKLPLISAKEFFSILNKLNFEKIRQKGSHVFFKHIDGRTTVVPDHSGEKLDRGLLNKIIKKDLKISRKMFMEVYEK